MARRRRPPARDQAPEPMTGGRGASSPPASPPSPVPDDDERVRLEERARAA